MVPMLLSLMMAAAAPAPQFQTMPGRPDIAAVRADDPEMNDAKARARASLPEFFRHLANPGAGEHGFTVKFDLDPSPSAEFIWAGDLEREGDHWVGTLINEPVTDGFSQGQRVVIRESTIIDWNYTRNGVAMGHHTTRVLLRRMPEAEAEAIRRQLGWATI